MQKQSLSNVRSLSSHHHVSCISNYTKSMLLQTYNTVKSSALAKTLLLPVGRGKSEEYSSLLFSPSLFILVLHDLGPLQPFQEDLY